MSRRPERDPESVTDLKWALPLAMVLLLMPPILTVFDHPVLVAGIPLLHVYLFAVWILGIAATAWLSRRLRRATDHAPPRDGG
ncbi:hypothetical protein [Amorphus coralli]|uniref:hypothetical protein n=1 Tax=Amorphus coralli TaxID=340680 RepID=UPI000376CB33|nr:hypothetical protein [Amorphus coralli]